jgi:hypothetical protein
MPIIQVKNLQKTFFTKRKAAGLRGSLRAVFKTEFQTIQAVRGISFEGELAGGYRKTGASREDQHSRADRNACAAGFIAGSRGHYAPVSRQAVRR